METVLSLIGWQSDQDRRGERRGRCPVCRAHGGRRPVFVVNGSAWYCHRCKQGGNQLELYQAVERLELLEAAVRLCERAGVEVPYLPRRQRQPRPPRARTEKRNP